MLRKEFEVLEQFVKRPWVRLTLKEVKRLSGKKSQSYVYNTLKRFAKEGILKEGKAGNVVLYSLDLSPLKSRVYAGFVAEYIALGQQHIPRKDIERVVDKMPTAFHILIITGSYARKTQKKGSDIDLVVIIDDSVDPKKVYAELRHECEMNIPPIHLYAFKKSEFVSMLTGKKPNYGKEIVKNSIIMSGGDVYYQIIREAMENGFDG